MTILSACYLLLTVLQTDARVNLGDEFHNITDESSSIEFIERHKNSADIASKAYVIGAKANQALYQVAPWEKVSTFNKAYEDINNLAEIAPENIEVRYIRWLIQTQAPPFLREKGVLDADILFLEQTLKQDFYNFKL